MGAAWKVLFTIISLGVTDDLGEVEQTNRRAFTGASLFVGVAGPVWGAIYISLGELGPGLIPSVYSAITAISFILLWRNGGWRLFRVTQLALIFALPIALMLSLGGYGPGSGVIIWAVLAPLGSLWSGRSREAIGWSAAFLLATVAAGVVDPYLRDSNDLPDGVIIVFFVMNLAFVTSIIFLLLDFYVGQKDRMIFVISRNRELESAFLAQELTLRQNDKLATLGKLSAGMAHELNNPTAAAQQATQQLGALLVGDQHLAADLTGLELLDAERDAVDSFTPRVGNRVQQPEFLDPLDRSDREAAVQDHLEDAGVDDAWDVAPALVGLGLDIDDLTTLAGRLRPDRYASVVTVVAEQFKRQSLLVSLEESTQRIIEIVKALKSYSYLDRADRQLVDLHEGLDSTLVVLQNRLRVGIEVQRAYADDLPQIEAYGNELNQVWTNILDNAIDAMDSRGSIRIVTRSAADHVVVEFTDDGPGIPADIIDNIFDPFVTSKPPGEGTGLGLNISFNIITEKHGGEIAVWSVPGRTTFTIKLPLSAPRETDRDTQTRTHPSPEPAYRGVRS
jgi:signal transduction histidine kinase